MKKILSMICALAVSVSAAFCYEGLMSGAEDVRYVQTEWFDIIFPASSSQTAYELSLQADSIYADICEKMCMTPRLRFPVVITSSMEVFNAYFSNYTGNHIVLFDTVPEESMCVFDETIVNTFRHELNHALTINDTSSVNGGLLKLFGDVYNFGANFMPQLMTEGSSVAYESRGGAGRLHDEYYLQMIKQAKLMDKFPSWRDVLGGRDIYPSGSMSYGFGGPFTEYIQRTYGMEKYAALWYKVVNYRALGLSSAFKKVYGISVTDAWKAFKEQIEVPEVAADPLTVDGIESFFDGTENDRLSRWEMISWFDKGIAFMDCASNTAYIAYRNDDGSYGTPSKLFNRVEVQGFSVSKDGMFAAVSCVGENYDAEKNELYIYSLSGNSFFKIPGTGLRDGAVIKSGDDYYAAAFYNNGQNGALRIYSLEASGKSVKSAELVKEIQLERGDIAFTPVDAGNGKMAYLYKHGLEWSVRESSVTGEGDAVVYEAPVPDMRIRYLSSSFDAEGNTVYSFSYTVPGSFPRLGLLKKSADGNAQWKLMKEQLSGGVWFNAVDGSRAVYSGYFVDSYKLMTMDLNAFAFEEYASGVSSAAAAVTVEKSEELTAFEEGSLKYNDFMTEKAMVLPYFASEYLMYDTSTGSLSLSSAQDIGISYLFGNLWDSNYTQFGGGYDSTTGSLVLGGAVSGGSYTSRYSWSAGGNALFGENGFRQAAAEASVSSYTAVGNHSGLLLKNALNATAGKTQIIFYDDVTGAASIQDDGSDLVFCADTVTLQFSTIHQAGSGYFQKAGAAIGTSCSVNLYGYVDDLAEGNYMYGYSISPFLGIDIPQMLPFDCVNGMTYNLPASAILTMYPNSGVFGVLQAEVMLFAIEIQKGIPFLPVYFNRFGISAGYEGYLYNQDSSRYLSIVNVASDVQNIKDFGIYDNVYLAFTIAPRLNIGAWARTTGTSGTLNISYTIHKLSESASPFTVQLKSSIMF